MSDTITLSNTMNILYLITGMGLGGAEKCVADLADQFTQRGHNVHVIYMTGRLLTKPHSAAIKIYSLEMSRNPYSIMRAILRYCIICHKAKPTVIHSHMYHANIFSRLTRFLVPKVKLINTAHSCNEGGALRMLAYNLTNCLCDTFTIVSQAAKQSFVEKKPPVITS